MDSLVDSVPLVLNTRAVQHVGVNLYVDDKGTAKGLPINARASAIAQACGKMLEVRGDAFIGRVFDNGEWLWNGQLLALQARLEAHGFALL